MAGRRREVQRQRYYLGTYLQDRDDEWVTLLIRDFSIRVGKGKLYRYVTTDALRFPNAEAMVEAIESGGWKELPPEADGNPRYVPNEFRDTIAA